MSRWLSLTLVLSLSVVPLASADNEVGFVEKFVLSADRERALEQLVPGTEAYYYFHALHYETSGQKPKLRDLLKQWGARFPNSPQRRVIENRQALLNFEADPEGTFTFLKDRLHLQLEHAPEVAPEDAPNEPSVLDQKLISAEAFRREALNQSRDDLARFSDHALLEMVRTKAPLTAAQRRALLSRIRQPDVAGLVDLVAAELRTKESAGFGGFEIHRALLPEQLDDLAKRVPGLFDAEKFVAARLQKFRPSEDVDMGRDPAEYVAWLERVWAYAKNLSPSFNSLKAAILYARLDLDRKEGKYDRARFVEYLKLPRNSGIANPTYTRKLQNSGGEVDFSATYEVLAPVPAIQNDEPLLREYLLHFYADENSWEPFATYLRDTYLKPIFAEAKLTAGVGSAEQWASLLSPAAMQALKEKVELEWSRTNAPLFESTADVALALTVKNTPKIIVRIYELNALTFFLSQHRQLNTDVNLDGLIANAEKTLSFDDAAARSPFRRVQRSIALPELAGKRGAWMVEVIGSGKSSRALIRKGQYELLQEPGPAGDLITIVDEKRAVVKDAVVWVEGRRYEPDAKLGKISIPFTAEAGSKPIVLASANGEFASLTQFQHSAEDYALDAQFHLAREQVLAGKPAALAVRAVLRHGGTRLPAELLEEPRLRIEMTLLDGLSTVREITAAEGLKFDAANLYTTEMQVPERLTSLTVTLTAKIARLSKGGEKQELSQAHAWSLNGIAQVSATYGAHLARAGAGYRLELRGRNGEPMRRLPVLIGFWHQDYTPDIGVSLRSDAEGRIDLGTLAGISRLALTLPETGHAEWTLPVEGATRQPRIHLLAGEPLIVSWPHGTTLTREAASLLEVRGETFVADRFAALAVKDGALQAENLPAGDYELRLMENGQESLIRIRVTAGAAVDGWLLSASRYLERGEPAPVRIASVKEDGGAILVQLAQASRDTRVHVAARRYVPTRGWSLTGLAPSSEGEPGMLSPAWRPNLYISGRDLGDEYRYILERRYTKTFPGNLLPRPGLILNPWEVRVTDTHPQTTSMGAVFKKTDGDFEGRMAGAAKRAEAPKPQLLMQPALSPESAREPDLDFLATTGAVAYNLVPNEQGLVRIERAALGDRPELEIYAVDLTSAAWKYVVLTESAPALRDRRLTQPLPPEKAFAEQRQVTAVPTGGTWSGAAGSDYRVYDSLARVYTLFTASWPQAQLEEFAFILRWPQLSEDEKKAKYSEYACHELNLFLGRKDPAFFRAVVEPYLRNKKDRTFVDDYLLGADLAPYLRPWNYERLNAGERALLAQHVAAERGSIARQLREEYEQRPPAPEGERHAFEMALRGQESGEVEKSLAQGARFADLNAPSPVPMAAPAEGKLGGAGIMLSESVSNTGRVRTKDKQLREDVASPAVAGRVFVRGQAELSLGADDVRRLREAVRPFFTKIGPTKEWAENNYYHLRVGPHELAVGYPVPLTNFWRDVAEWDGKAPFLSSHFHDLQGQRAELLFALAMLDLPFTAPKHQARVENGRVTITAAGPLLVVHKEIVPAAAGAAGTLLVGENFFRVDDRFRQEGNEKFDKFVTDEFLPGVVYGASVVITNPGSGPQWLEVLTQIPEGAIPVRGTEGTHSQRLHLNAYTTTTLEYAFYFPEVRTEPFLHHPVQVTREGKLLASAAARTFRVVPRLTQVDETSWEHLSQSGTDAQVLAYLEAHNLHLTALERVAWRAKARPEFLKQLVALLEKRHVYSDTIYAYGVLHRVPAITRELLRHHDDFVQECGPWLRSPLLTIDPIERKTYEHLEYTPLINQRTHRLGAENRIANGVFRGQYQALLGTLACKPALEEMDQLSLVYYLFLQDRIEEALARLKAVRAEALPTKLQYDYLRCYAAFYEENLAEARGLASQYASYGVDRWRRLFQGVLAQLEQIEGRTAPGQKPVPGRDGTQRELDQSQLSSAEPTFEFKMEGDKLALSWKALREVTVNYYLMDPEFLFSASPFATDDPSRFAIVRPALSQKQALPEGQAHVELPLPDQFQRANLLIEILGAGQRKVQAHHANSLRLNLVENYGRLDLRDAATGKPLPRSYVKVYARLKGGTVRFYKDGYTDLRGAFDYASLNSGGDSTPRPIPQQDGAGSGTGYQLLQPAELGQVEKLSILVLTEKNGATTREAGLPAE